MIRLETRTFLAVRGAYVRISEVKPSCQGEPISRIYGNLCAEEKRSRESATTSARKRNDLIGRGPIERMNIHHSASRVEVDVQEREELIRVW